MTEATNQEPVPAMQEETVSSDTPTTDRPMTVVELAELFRDDLKFIEGRAREFAKFNIKMAGEPLYDMGECIAQAMLAIRHIEDARMRFGQVIQYATTGESSYTR